MFSGRPAVRPSVIRPLTHIPFDAISLQSVTLGTNNIDIVKCCQSHFCFDLPIVVHGRRAGKFDIKYSDHSNRFCQMISHL